MADFFEAAGDKSTWDKISRNGLERIRSRRGTPCSALCSHGTGMLCCTCHEDGDCNVSKEPVHQALLWRQNHCSR